MNVAMIQPPNGYSQYYFALDNTFFEARLLTSLQETNVLTKGEPHTAEPPVPVPLG